MYSSSEKKLDILNDHYKDTFSHLVSYRKQRDRLLLYLLVTVGLMFLYQLFPEETTAAISEAVKKQIGVNWGQSAIFVDRLPLIFIFIMGFRYWQVWHLIERQYCYLQKLEKELASLFSSGVPFTRESNFSYMEHPNLSIWGHKIYNLFFMTMLWFTLPLSGLMSWFKDSGFGWIWLIGLIGWIIFILYQIFSASRKRRKNVGHDEISK